MKNKNLKEAGFIATAVLYSLAALLMIIFLIILTNYKTTRDVQVDEAQSAKTQLSKYKIEYHPTSGVGEMETSIAEVGKDFELPESQFQKTGAEFMGWSLDPNADESILDYPRNAASVEDYKEEINSVINFPEKHTDTSTETATVRNLANPQGTCPLYAVWKWNDYIIHFESSSGATNMPNDIVKYYGFDINLPNTTPTKKGYIFKGWSLTPNSSKVDYAKNAIFNLNGDTTLYAVWKKNELIVDGGTVSFYQTACSGIYSHGSLPEPSSGECSVSGNRVVIYWKFTSSGGGHIAGASYNTFDVTDFDYVTINYKSEGSGTVSIGSASQSISKTKDGSVTLNISNVTGNRNLNLAVNFGFNDGHTIENRSTSTWITSLRFFS